MVECERAERRTFRRRGSPIPGLHKREGDDLSIVFSFWCMFMGT